MSFFVRNNYTHLNSSLSYSAAQFLLYAYRDVTIAGNVYLRGYVVADGELELEGGAKVEGGVTSDDISLKDGSWIDFEDTAASINVVPDCGVEPV